MFVVRFELSDPTFGEAESKRNSRGTIRVLRPLSFFVFLFSGRVILWLRFLFWGQSEESRHKTEGVGLELVGGDLGHDWLRPTRVLG